MLWLRLKSLSGTHLLRLQSVVILSHLRVLSVRLLTLNLSKNTSPRLYLNALRELILCCSFMTSLSSYCFRPGTFNCCAKIRFRQRSAFVSGSSLRYCAKLVDSTFTIAR